MSRKGLPIHGISIVGRSAERYGLRETAYRRSDTESAKRVLLRARNTQPDCDTFTSVILLLVKYAIVDSVSDSAVPISHSDESSSPTSVSGYRNALTICSPVVFIMSIDLGTTSYVSSSSLMHISLTGVISTRRLPLIKPLEIKASILFPSIAIAGKNFAGMPVAQLHGHVGNSSFSVSIRMHLEQYSLNDAASKSLTSESTLLACGLKVSSCPIEIPNLSASSLLRNPDRFIASTFSRALIEASTSDSMLAFIWFSDTFQAVESSEINFAFRSFSLASSSRSRSATLVSTWFFAWRSTRAHHPLANPTNRAVMHSKIRGRDWFMSVICGSPNATTMVTTHDATDIALFANALIESMLLVIFLCNVGPF